MIISSDEAFLTDLKVKQLKKNLNGGFLELAKELKKIRDERLYEQLDYVTFEAYIAQPELAFDRSNVFRFIQIYEEFVLKLNVAPGRLVLTDWTKLRAILPHVNEENKERLLQKAQSLSRSDLLIEINQEFPRELKIPPPLVGKYRTIVVDPPWPIEFIDREVRLQQNITYETMTIEEIIVKTPIIDLADDFCNLFLWTTHTFLPDTFKILERWGFKYHVCLTWDKQSGMSFFGFHRRTEFVIYAYKGKITMNDTGPFVPTLFSEKAREHSRKPDLFYDYLRQNTPEPRVDLYSREKREGFDQWGDQVTYFEKRT